MTPIHVMVVKMADLIIWKNKDILMCPDRSSIGKELMIPRYVLGGTCNVYEFLREEIRVGCRMSIGGITALPHMPPVPAAIGHPHWIDVDVRVFTAQYQSSFPPRLLDSLEPEPRWVPAKLVLEQMLRLDLRKQENMLQRIEYLTESTKDH